LPPPFTSPSTSSSLRCLSCIAALNSLLSYILSMFAPIAVYASHYPAICNFSKLHSVSPSA
jgi:hypothetical protein